MVAKQKILPGDVLMVDTAYATSLFEDYYKSHCNMCFIRITGEPVPCPTCNTVSYKKYISKYLFGPFCNNFSPLYPIMRQNNKMFEISR